MPDGSAVSKKTKAGPISADRLKSFVERIEKLEEERKAIGGDIRDVYSEAKGVGYDVKTSATQTFPAYAGSINLQRARASR